jgi:predicted nucleic acid-binding protein
MLLDSNIVIYATNPEHSRLRDWLRGRSVFISVVTLIEVMGYHRLPEAERAILEEFFRAIPVLSLDTATADRAIALRQARRMSLGDAIIAATALIHALPLATHNLKDFADTPGLRTVDSMSST